MLLEGFLRIGAFGSCSSVQCFCAATYWSGTYCCVCNFVEMVVGFSKDVHSLAMAMTTHNVARRIYVN